MGRGGPVGFPHASAKEKKEKSEKGGTMIFQLRGTAHISPLLLFPRVSVKQAH